MFNRPDLYQYFIQNRLGKYVNDFYTGYLDKILIYIENKLEHKTYLSWIELD